MKRLLQFTCMAICITSQAYAQNWGLNNTRTETRDDAGAYGPGVKSGFYQTSNPIHFPTGANGWWHLLDVRNNDSTINFAMQFAGSIFDQQLYFRKTINNGSNNWSRVLLETGGSAADADTMRMSFSKFGEGGWINFPTTGPSGIGSNGPGSNAWIGYASQPSLWFPNAGTGDICYRNTRGKMLFGNSGDVGAIMAIVGNKIGIGTLTPSEILSVVGNIKDVGNLSVVGNIVDSGNLSVNGFITSKKLTITQSGWADYVFEPSYKLLPLKEVEEHIARYKHLPDVPSAAEVDKEGLDIGSNQTVLLKKIEELTLYVIEQNKRIEEQSRQMQILKKEVRSRKSSSR